MTQQSLSLRQQYGYLPKDFIETSSGHVLALVHWGVERERLLATLRYKRRADGRLEKLSTVQAQREVLDAVPHWQVDCPLRHVKLTGVPVEEVVQHYRPENAWEALSSRDKTAALRSILDLNTNQAGITGSFLVGANHAASDLDVVVYGIEAFMRVRQRVKQAFLGNVVEPLTTDDWRATYTRRGCQITFDDYCWHELRKRNKFNLSGLRVDLSCVGNPMQFLSQPFRKIEKLTLQATVIDDSQAYALPAVYGIDAPSIQRVVSFTPTYTGQAKVGERVVASGWLEEGPSLQRQLLIGTSREAGGEFLRTLLGQ